MFHKSDLDHYLTVWQDMGNTSYFHNKTRHPIKYVLHRIVHTYNTLVHINLAFSGCGLIDKKASYLATIITNNPTLKYLSLQQCGLGVTAALAIANSLKKNDTLQYLSLYGNDIGDQGGWALARCFDQNHTLQELDLGWNELTDNAIMVHLVTASQLRMLAIKYNHLYAMQNLSSHFMEQILFEPQSFRFHPNNGRNVLSVTVNTMLTQNRCLGWNPQTQPFFPLHQQRALEEAQQQLLHHLPLELCLYILSFIQRECYKPELQWK